MDESAVVIKGADAPREDASTSAGRSGRSRDLPTAGEPRVPRQRGRRGAVLVLLDPHETQTELVEFAARTAELQGAPLVIAVLTAGIHVGAPCMAALDTALQIARGAAPHLSVRVDTISPGAAAAHVLSDDLVVVNPQTWSRLPDDLRAGRTGGPLLELVGARSGSSADEDHVR
jgi:hypothetical protein